MKQYVQLQIALGIVILAILLTLLPYIQSFGTVSQSSIYIFSTTLVEMLIIVFLYKFIKKDKQLKFSDAALILLLLNGFVEIISYFFVGNLYSEAGAYYEGGMLAVILSSVFSFVPALIGNLILMIEFMNNKAEGRLGINIKWIGYSILGRLIAGFLFGGMTVLLLTNNSFGSSVLFGNTFFHLLYLLATANLYWHELKEF